MTIGFIGTGIMGCRMATHLQKEGHTLVIHNRTREKATSLIEQGATWAASPAEVGQQVDFVFTMLAHPKAVTDMALGKVGFLNALSPKALWVDCSTVHPAFSRQMAEEAARRQLHHLDAPVAGSKKQAQDAALVFIVGGREEDVERCRPLFEVMGQRVLHVGSHGMGTSLKVVMNLLLATSMAAFAESVALGQALGLPQELLFNVLMGGPVAAPFVTMKREKLEQGVYEPDFSLQWMQKDLQMAAVAAYETGAALPLGNAAKELYRLAMHQGLGEEDFSAIYQFLSV